jgi:hypothetical protein
LRVSAFFFSVTSSGSSLNTSATSTTGSVAAVARTCSGEDGAAVRAHGSAVHRHQQRRTVRRMDSRASMSAFWMAATSGKMHTKGSDNTPYAIGQHRVPT